MVVQHCPEKGRNYDEYNVMCKDYAGIRMPARLCMLLIIKGVLNIRVAPSLIIGEKDVAQVGNNAHK